MLPRARGCKARWLVAFKEVMSTLGELHTWLQANGFTIIHEGIGPKGIQLLVKSYTGRILQMTHKPGVRPSKWAPTLEEVLIDEINPQDCPLH